MWQFFAKNKESNAHNAVALSTVDAVVEQIRRVRQSLGPQSSNLSLLKNVNCLISGYALGVASAELSHKSQMTKGLEKPLAGAIKSAFEGHGFDIQVWDHYDGQSYAFLLG